MDGDDAFYLADIWAVLASMILPSYLIRQETVMDSDKFNNELLDIGTIKYSKIKTDLHSQLALAGSISFKISMLLLP